MRIFFNLAILTLVAALAASAQGDEPSTATALLVNGIQSGPYTTVGATVTPSQPLATCWQPPTLCGTYVDVWFQFVATDPEMFIEFTNAGSTAGGIENPSIALWENLGGGTYSQIGCASYANNYGYDDLSIRASGLAYSLVVGNTYLIQVASLCFGGTDQFGNFYLTLSAPPQNNLIANAVNLPADGVSRNSYSGVTFTDKYSTSTGSPSPPSCWQPSCPQGDVWFKFIATATGKIEVKLSTPSNTIGETVNPYLALWASDGTTLIDCASSEGTNSYLDIGLAQKNLTTGATYFISVASLCSGGPNGSPSWGTFSLTLDDNITYDFYEGALALSVNTCSATNSTFDNIDKTSDGPNTPCGGSINKNVWFKFTATTTDARIIIRMGDNYGGINQDIFRAYLTLWAINGSGSLTVLRCTKYYSNSHTALGLAYKGLTVNNTYYISVDSDLAAEGRFGICLFDNIDNDFFEGATSLGDLSGWCSNALGEDNTFCTRDLIDQTGNISTPSCWTQSGGANRWYKFTASTPKVSIQLKTKQSGGSGFLKFPLLALYKSDRTLLDCSNPDVTDGTASILYTNLTPGDDYYITIDSGFGDENSHLVTGLYTICVNCEVYFSRASGNWNNSSTWSFIDYDEAAASDVPTTTYKVWIRGRDIEVTDSQGAKEVQLNLKDAATRLTIDAGALIVLNDIKINNAGLNYPQKLDVGTVSSNGSIDVNGNIILTNSPSDNLQSIHTHNSSTINIAGNFVRDAAPNNYGSLNCDIGSTIIMDGLNTQTLTTNVGRGTDAFKYGEVEFSNSAITVPQISLDGAVETLGNITFTQGVVQTTPSKPLTIKYANAIGGSVSSYVNGALSIVTTGTTGALSFPTGKPNATIPEKIYHPAAVSYNHTDATDVTYTGEYFQTSAATISTTVDPSLTHVSGLSYWRIGRSGTSNVFATVKLDFNFPDSVSDLSHLAVANFNPTVGGWVNIGNGATSNIGTDAKGDIKGNITSSAFPGWEDLFTLANTQGGGNSLPVTLVGFNAKQENNGVLLEWSTLSEINNDHFEIEHSDNGLSFHLIGTMPGHGTTNIKQNYQFVHHPYSKQNYYKLKQIDYDGSKSSTEVVHVVYDGTLNRSVDKIYPNPSKDGVFFIELSSSGSSPPQISVTNSIGQKVFCKVEVVGSDIKIIKVTSPESNGLYFIYVYLKDRVEVIKAMIER